MAGQRKRTKKDSESSENDSESESYHGQEEIQADFEGRNPEREDFHGIKQLLKQLFLRAHVDLGQLTDLLIEQAGVGSVLKQSLDDESDEDDAMSSACDVFGITSVVNLSSHRGTPCVQQIIDLVKNLSEKHSDKVAHERIKSLLADSNRLGLLINERFVNIPAKISDPLLTSLQNELERIRKKDATYNFDYLLLICKLYRPKGEESSEAIFSNAEEELFSKEAEIGFEFDVTDESDTGLTGKWVEGDKLMLPHRRLLFIRANKLPNIVQQIKQFVA